MARGGIYDHVGGGFHRYSVDAAWHVPHFEKMLYDNSQLARVYLHAWQIGGDPAHRRVVEETLDWVRLEMTHPQGGFFSTLDADSEGEEGKFYVWSLDELREVLGTDADLVADAYDVSARGNWEGVNVLRRLKDLDVLAYQHDTSGQDIQVALDSARPRMFERRSGSDSTRARRQDHHSLERPHDRGLCRSRPQPRPRRLCRHRHGRRRVLPQRTLARRQSAVAHLEGRPRPVQRLPGGLRLPGRRPAGAVPDHLRRTLVRRGPRALRRHAGPTSRIPKVGSSTPATTTKRWSPGRRTCKTTPRPQVGPWRSACWAVCTR